MELINEKSRGLLIPNVCRKRILPNDPTPNGVIVTTFLGKSVTYKIDAKPICDQRPRKRKPFTFEEKF